MAEPAAEVRLAAHDVRRLVDEQHPSFVGKVRLFSHGWDNDLFRLGDDWAVRLPRRRAAADLILHEQRWLPELSGRLPVPTPVPVAVGLPTAQFPWRWSIVPWLPGSRLADLSPGERDDAADDVAAALAALHTPAPAEAPRSPHRGIALHERDAGTRELLAGDPELLDLWRVGVAAEPWRGAPVWVHGDVHPGNLLVAEGRLSAVLDFGDVCAGDPACDLAIAWTAFTPLGRARMRAALGDRYDAAIWTRAAAWAALFAALLAGTRDPAFREVAAHSRAELVRELA
ncbi:phosphotransferase [Microbacterium sp.]|uniref:phosphotransferase n=1 Tax=Microbacterium sp. TaxID=51671 RepID=UPI0039E2CD5B